MTDSVTQTREEAIRAAGEEMAHFMGLWEKHGVFSDHAAAQAAMQRMYALIQGRSQEEVTELERERGLA